MQLGSFLETLVFISAILSILLILLQHCFRFTFCFFVLKACGIIAP